MSGLALFCDFTRFIGASAVALDVKAEALSDSWGTRARQFFSETSTEVWKWRLEGVARPLCVDDYRSLGDQASLTYLGYSPGEGEPVPDAVPKTMFDPSAFLFGSRWRKSSLELSCQVC